MDEALAEIVGWALHTVAAVAGGLGLFLMRWIQRVEREKEHQVQCLTQQLESLRLHAAEHYLRREDYVPQMSLMQSKLDGMSEQIGERLASQEAMLARLDERSLKWGEK